MRALLVKITVNSSLTVVLPVDAPPGTLTRTANVVRRGSVRGINVVVKVVKLVLKCAVLVVLNSGGVLWVWMPLFRGVGA